MAVDKGYCEKHCDSAGDLLELLLPFPKLQTQKPNPSFIFRGHAKACWELIPIALRIQQNGISRAQSLVDQGDGRQADYQVFSEIKLLDGFRKACDIGGVAIPGDRYQLRRRRFGSLPQNADCLKFPKKWPPDAYLPALAFAQHQGVPTRLLDWTRNPTAAAYFAACQQAEGCPESQECIAIWALNTEMLDNYGIELIEMPGANSARLGAQRGLFTLIRETAPRGGPATVRCLTLAKNSCDGSHLNSYLWKITLPKKERHRLLYLCDRYGVNAATMFPGAEGAARAALEQFEWLKRDPATGKCMYER